MKIDEGPDGGRVPIDRRINLIQPDTLHVCGVDSSNHPIEAYPLLSILRFSSVQSQPHCVVLTPQEPSVSGKSQF